MVFLRNNKYDNVLSGSIGNRACFDSNMGGRCQLEIQGKQKKVFLKRFGIFSLDVFHVSMGIFRNYFTILLVGYGRGIWIGTDCFLPFPIFTCIDLLDF